MTIEVRNNDVPTDPEALLAKRREQRDAAVDSAKTAVSKATAHLAAAKEALAQAIASRKELG